ncbi:ABC transporter permease subunit [Borrelia sp. A-FGy1]|uniref:ABC transporter permease subunit n=1 Tax=Borrelia sp. A-FGy1 TaxID=2608247 RepID=UPI0015F69C80|nr:ABC transporter permease [Borrelia sp. A-FGy1]QMU99493.1 ABC transporter permease subunit [Borrelia sp. A-FGy1]
MFLTLINIIISTFFCVSLLNIFSNNNYNIPFIRKNIFKEYLEYIGLLKSIESYKIVYDLDANIPLSKNYFAKHIAGNSYIVYKIKYKGLIWGTPSYSPLTKGKSTIKVIFNKIKNTLKISIPGIVFSYLISISFIIAWTLSVKNKSIDNILDYIMLFLNSLPRNLTVILLISSLYYLNINPKNSIIGGFGWFFSFFIFNAVIFKQALHKNLSACYIITAKSKGLKKIKIILVHALKPSLIPIITNLRSTLATAFFGTSIIEKMFGIDGIGSLTINAIKNNDYIIYKDLIFIGVFIMLISNLISDMLIYKINPYKGVT